MEIQTKIKQIKQLLYLYILDTHLDHGHKKRIVWKHGHPHKNLYVMLEFSKRPKTLGIILR